jgi:hypothetical protein
MNVYDFKGKGVAMSMYNTDEVGWTILFNPFALDILFLVNHRLRPFFLQDGSCEKDAFGS